MRCTSKQAMRLRSELERLAAPMLAGLYRRDREEVIAVLELLSKLDTDTRRRVISAIYNDGGHDNAR